MFAGIMASIVTSMFSGLGPAILVAAAFGAVLLAVSVKDKHDKSALGRTVTRVNWMRRRTRARMSIGVGRSVERSGGRSSCLGSPPPRS